MKELVEIRAGLRTHAIVALSSCLMMLISKYGFSDLQNYDGSRVASQIVSRDWIYWCRINIC